MKGGTVADDLLLISNHDVASKSGVCDSPSPVQSYPTGPCLTTNILNLILVRSGEKHVLDHLLSLVAFVAEFDAARPKSIEAAFEFAKSLVYSKEVDAEMRAAGVEPNYSKAIYINDAILPLYFTYQGWDKVEAPTCDTNSAAENAIATAAAEVDTGALTARITALHAAARVTYTEPEVVDDYPSRFDFGFQIGENQSIKEVPEEDDPEEEE